MLPRNLSLLLLASWPVLGFTEEIKPAKRHVYALHSGVHIILAHPRKNFAAERMRFELIERGIADRDIIVLDNPFPNAGPKNMFPREGLILFLESMSPASKVAHDAYLRFQVSLEKAGVGPDDSITWVGHSAGGQMGMTLAHLSRRLADFPELAKKARGCRLDTVITLGTPVGSNHVPADVCLRQYHSDADKVVRILCNTNSLLPLLGYQLKIRPASPNLGANGLVRVYDHVEHPDWIWERRVLDRIVREREDEPAPWQTPMPISSPGIGLAQLVSHWLEAEYRVALEDPKGL